MVVFSWKYLKAKLRKENSELVSTTTQLKLLASDGKRYLTDMLDYSGIIAVSHFLANTLKQIEEMPENTFDEIADKYVEMNID